MKDRIILTALLSIAIAHPALAQQTTTDQHTASSSQATSASSKETPRDSHTDFWEGDEPSAAALIFHPFASKGYVQRHTQPIRDRLNELEELNASNSRMTKDADTRTSKAFNWRRTRRKKLTSMPPMHPISHS